MLLAIDVSNTNTKLGFFDGARLVTSYRISTDRARTADEIGVVVLGLMHHDGIRLEDVSGLVISSVVPPLRLSLDGFCKRFMHVEPLFIEPGIKTGMPLKVDHPAEVGADRIVNAVAALDLVGGPAVVVDFGTATNFDVVSARGEYLGGVIAPGLTISAEALFLRAARLPLVAVERPERVIGRNTVQCMQSGLFHGYVGLVEGLLDRIARELEAAPTVIATGGHAEAIAQETERIQRIEPALTLMGLRILHSRNLKERA